jgi:hypothetical protein
MIRSLHRREHALADKAFAFAVNFKHFAHALDLMLFHWLPTLALRHVECPDLPYSRLQSLHIKVSKSAFLSRLAAACRGAHQLRR